MPYKKKGKKKIICPCKKNIQDIQFWTVLVSVNVMFLWYAIKHTFYINMTTYSHVKIECFIQYVGSLELKT
jgi:hypothetical protein